MDQQKVVLQFLSRTILFLCLSDLLLQAATAEDQVTYLQNDCKGDQKYNQESEYANNVDLLLSNLTSRASTNKFYNVTIGEAPNQVYGLYYCSYYVTDQVCNDCVTLAQGEIRRKCPSSVESIVWFIECTLRYANHSIFSINDDSVYRPLGSGQTKYSQYSQDLTDTFISLVSAATTGNASLSASTTIYQTAEISMTCFVDCTPDLSPSDCRNCFQTALSKLETPGAQSGGLLQPSCRLLYYFVDARSLSPGKGIYISLALISVVAAASLSSHVFVFLKRKKMTRKPTGLGELESMENLHFEFDAIKLATNNFSEANKIGKGGFGVVYLGTLANGQTVAVKRLSNATGQGIKEFKAEACLAAKLQHKNLVKLFGFCLQGMEMLLVYEFVPNKSLDRYLLGPKRGAILKREDRRKIIVGIAKGLSYLHEDSHHKIIHRDLKPGNILLDEEMNPKIADFGMAKLLGVDQTQENTSRVAGTFGYMAPEYAATGNISVKSDIFSYGVIVLEIVSGLRNRFSDPENQDEDLLLYAWRLWDERTHLKLVDSELGNNFPKDEVERCIYIGLLCTQAEPAKRPSIASVLLMLNTKPITFPQPAPPLPYRTKERAALHLSYDTQVEGDISDLLPR